MHSWYETMESAPRYDHREGETNRSPVPSIDPIEKLIDSHCKIERSHQTEDCLDQINITAMLENAHGWIDGDA